MQSKQKKVKRLTKTQLHKKAWAIVSAYLRKKYPMCEFCKVKRSNQVHHIFSRKYHSIKYNEDNLVALCPACHFHAHNNPEDFRKFIIAKIGEERYYELYRQTQEKSNITIEDLQNIIITYSDKLEKLEGLKEEVCEY